MNAYRSLAVAAACLLLIGAGRARNLTPNQPIGPLAGIGGTITPPIPAAPVGSGAVAGGSPLIVKSTSAARRRATQKRRQRLAETFEVTVVRLAPGVRTIVADSSGRVVIDVTLPASADAVEMTVVLPPPVGY